VALLGISAAVALLVLAPIGFLLDQTFSTGWDEVERLLFRSFVGELLVNTTTLVAVGTAACTVLGVAVAWTVERTDLPGRRAWAVLAALPITVPAFVTSYSWVSITPAVQGFWGAAGIVTLAYYPLVYLPVAAVLRGTDPALEESARSLGMGPWRTFFRVTLPQTRVALLGGMLLVAIHMLSEFGAFAMLRFHHGDLRRVQAQLRRRRRLDAGLGPGPALPRPARQRAGGARARALRARGLRRGAPTGTGPAGPGEVGGGRRLPGPDRARARPAPRHPRLLGRNRRQRG
jgi:ABC-type spermidine/putrescine transport system permease subunit II